jgi:UDP-N-acetylmuramoyl-tripeptide--D-alanyl-D-alanine ligase
MFDRSGPLVLTALAGAFAYLVWRRLLAYLRYFQQEGYEALRFVRWVKLRSLTDPALWLAALCSVLLAVSAAVAAGLFVAGALLLGAAQPDPRRSGKIALRLTWRARRVLAASAVLVLAVWLGLVVGLPASTIRSVFIASVGVLAVVPIVLVAANASLAPYERAVQRRYEVEARQRVAAVAPFIIGITGSYGKSSTKAMLAHILQLEAPTLAASGSINTLMGVTRHLREQLVHGHRFLVVEMGAFKRGSIARLCELTPPRAGLVTAVGDMHLERFGSTDEIVRAKSELAAALPPGGLLVANADNAGALRIAQGATHCRVLLYGETYDGDLDTRVEGVTFSREGTHFVLRTRARAFACFTPLLGRPIIQNVAGAFTLAAAVGVDPDLIEAAHRTLRPVANRLEIVEERGITWIRDAYNSNQVGFRAALEVASALPAARRFLATPGVIELGPEQFRVNRALAKEAAAVCDATLIVSEANREAFVAGYRDARRDETLVSVPTRSEAFRWLRDTVRDGDAVILENDLPDLYERSAGVFWKSGARQS